MAAPPAPRPISRILLVTDDPTVADSCARALRLDGHEVWAALSADDGLRLARTHAPHAVVVDVRTPLACTLGLVETLRRLPHLAVAPIAIVSGDRHPARATLQQLSALGIQVRYKPHWLNELVALSPLPGAPRVKDRFLRACRRQPVDATPVWFMRQAGRYMAEYRALRQQHSLLDICRNPDLATEVTLQPVRRIPVDAAILFSDLLIPLAPLGLPFDFVGGEGPKLERPISSTDDIDRLRRFDPREDLAFVLTAIGRIQQELAGQVPLIGFAGAPFTLASYAIEGGHSNSFAKTKALMYGHPEAWHRLCSMLAELVGDYLVAQIDAGVDAVQVFDSWVGHLNAADYVEFAQPHSQRIFDIVGDRVPTIHFGTGTAMMLGEMAQAGGQVVGADWRIGIDEAWDRIGHDRAIQGNLDPTTLLGPVARMYRQVDDIVARVNRRPGHIFNLGHGILPSTPVEHVQMLASYVHQVTARPTP